jgi:hypothetical protein
MDFLRNATDDQIALMGCFVALVTSAALMYVSVYLNRTQRKTQIRKDAGHTLPLAARDERSAQTTQVQTRKVA